MRKIFIGLIILIVGVMSYNLIQSKSEQAITYFPLDHTASFNEAETLLKQNKQTKANTYQINWETRSQTDKASYLRQDVSLLFKDGQLIGALTKWQQNTANLSMQKSQTARASHFFQSISFHYSEIHQEKNTIKSNQYMSDASLYTVQSPNMNQVKSFTTPKNKESKQWQKTLQKSTNHKLNQHWSRLMRHFQINMADYKQIPLSQLAHYNQNPFPNLTQAETDQAIGRLWEGLYDNYIIPITTKKMDLTSAYMPIILLANDHSHLLVLYQLDGKMQKLIQHL